jgi:hypothetical protein
VMDDPVPIPPEPLWIADSSPVPEYANLFDISAFYAICQVTST